MELLRRLPAGERGVMVDVVKMTLESLNVQVDAIVDDATRREAEIARRIDVLHGELAEYEQAVLVRWDEIKQLEVEQEEIAHVKHQLTGEHETTKPLEVVKAPSNDESDQLGRVLATLKVT